jgi:hypothetical protein
MDEDETRRKADDTTKTPAVVVDIEALLRAVHLYFMAARDEQFMKSLADDELNTFIALKPTESEFVTKRKELYSDVYALADSRRQYERQISDVGQRLAAKLVDCGKDSIPLFEFVHAASYFGEGPDKARELWGAAKVILQELKAQVSAQLPESDETPLPDNVAGTSEASDTAERDDEVAQRLAAHSMTETAPDSQPDEMPALSDRQYLILQTLLIMKATTADARQTTARIVEKAVGRAADPVQFKKDIASLKADGFIDTKSGAGGGCWLTTKGRNVASRLG